MEQGGCEHEAEAVGEAGGSRGHFRAVGKAVKEGEYAYDSHAGGCGKAGGGGDEQAEHEDGGGDALFGAGDLKTTVAEDGAEGHHADEGGGHEPAGASAELRGPEADGDHGEKVVPAAERMDKAAAEIPAEAVVAVMARVGAGDGGQEGEDGAELEKTGGESGFHDFMTATCRPTLQGHPPIQPSSPQIILSLPFRRD